jgi:preprotein translocase subunit SecA
LLTYQSKITELSVYGDGIIENLERSIILINTDRIWREHLQKMTLLREAVGWRGYDKGIHYMSISKMPLHVRNS